MEFGFPEWQRILLLIPAILIAITVHEFMHAYVADRLGDPTARAVGRLTLNPIKHLDPIGAIVFLVVGFGWAKPVPINPDRFKNPRLDTVWVSLAGPGANFVAAGIFAVILTIVGFDHVLAPALYWIIRINLILMVFNLIPIPPLDGASILPLFLPRQHLGTWYKFEQYGMFILLGILLFLPGLIGELINPPVNAMLGMFGIV